MSSPSGRAPLLAALATLILITVATNTTAALAQPQIGAQFGVGPADTGWVVFGYSATFAVATALFGGIAARTGVMPALVAGVTLLGIGSLLAAVAPSLEVLIGSRLLQGLGSGAIPTLSSALIAHRIPARQRTAAFGVVVGSVGAGQAVGPIVGGLLLELIGWRAAVSIGVVAIPAVLVLWLTQRGQAEPRHDDPHAFDAVGAILVSVSALGLAFSLNRLPLVGLIPVTAVAVATLAAALGGLAWRSARRPDSFVPLRIVGHPTFRHVVLIGGLGMSAYLGSIVLVPVVAARAYDLDGIVLGLLLLPMAVAAALSAPNAGRVESRLGPSRTTRLSLGCLAAGTGGLAIGTVAIGPPAMLASLAVLGVGFGLLNAPLLSELTHAFTGRDQPVAVGLYNLCFFLSGGIGAAISTAVLQGGVELPLLGGAPVPGFATAELLLMLGPLALALIGVRRPRAEPASPHGLHAEDASWS